MQIILDEKMKAYMLENGYKDIILEPEMKYISACLGYHKTVKVCFTDKCKEGFLTANTEVGNVYYQEEEIWLSEKPEIHLKKTPWELNFELMGIRANK